MVKRCLDTPQIESKLKAAGIQPTLQRIAICRYVLCEADHPTAEQVLSWAQEHLDKISQATVYNTLGTLVEAGLLRALRLGHSDKVIYDHNVEPHHHFLDESSGRLYDLPYDSVQVKASIPRRFQKSGFDLVIRGRVASGDYSKKSD